MITFILQPMVLFGARNQTVISVHQRFVDGANMNAQVGLTSPGDGEPTYAISIFTKPLLCRMEVGGPGQHRYVLLNIWHHFCPNTTLWLLLTPPMSPLVVNPAPKCNRAAVDPCVLSVHQNVGSAPFPLHFHHCHVKCQLYVEQT